MVAGRIACVDGEHRSFTCGLPAADGEGGFSPSSALFSSFTSSLSWLIESFTSPSDLPTSFSTCKPWDDHTE